MVTHILFINHTFSALLLFCFLVTEMGKREALFSSFVFFPTLYICAQKVAALLLLFLAGTPPLTSSPTLERPDKRASHCAWGKTAQVMTVIPCTAPPLSYGPSLTRCSWGSLHGGSTAVQGPAGMQTLFVFCISSKTG